MGFIFRDTSQRQLLDISQPDSKRVGELMRGPFAVAFKDNSLRQAIDLMAREGLGRVPVVERENSRKVVGILSDSDIRSAIRTWLEHGGGKANAPLARTGLNCRGGGNSLRKQWTLMS